eukprot:551028-Rhodomonas_salina.1
MAVCALTKAARLAGVHGDVLFLLPRRAVADRGKETRSRPAIAYAASRTRVLYAALCGARYSPTLCCYQAAEQFGGELI